MCLILGLKLKAALARKYIVKQLPIDSGRYNNDEPCSRLPRMILDGIIFLPVNQFIPVIAL